MWPQGLPVILVFLDVPGRALDVQFPEPRAGFSLLPHTDLRPTRWLPDHSSTSRCPRCPTPGFSVEPRKLRGRDSRLLRGGLALEYCRPNYRLRAAFPGAQLPTRGIGCPVSAGSA